MKKNSLIFAIIIAIATSCGTGEKSRVSEYLEVPEEFRPIPFPDYNQFSQAKVELGRYLFYEKELSQERDLSCESCHQQEYAFCDGGVKLSRGYRGENEIRNSMPLFNAAYYGVLFWDGHSSKLEEPAYRGIWLPMIFGSDTVEINRRLRNHEYYPSMFKKAFGDVEPNCYLAAQAIATFVRTLVSANSPYDKYVRGDESALTSAQKRGMELFFSDRVHCVKCHDAPLFTNNKFHNTATTTHYFDRGRFYVTGVESDKGLFKTPTLRNVEVTYPYMHDGEFHTLEEVVRHYNRGGLSWFYKDSLIVPLGLKSNQMADIVEFLKALTDKEFLEDTKFSNPFLSEKPFSNGVENEN